MLIKSFRFVLVHSIYILYIKHESQSANISNNILINFFIQLNTISKNILFVCLMFDDDGYCYNDDSYDNG